jgi:hypothetical protein
MGRSCQRRRTASRKDVPQEKVFSPSSTTATAAPTTTTFPLIFGAEFRPRVVELEPDLGRFHQRRAGVQPVRDAAEKRRSEL